MEGTPPVTNDGQILDRTLDNGLKVILREAHDAPLASFWVWYRVGSRNELPGLTGVSHWVEHMQFKGTPSLEKGAIFRDVSKNGGTLNALTSSDWTGYFETLPVDRLDLSLQIESDRMVNSLFDPEETESERTVILSERQGAENSPTYLLYEEVVGAAYHAHPYGHMVVGHEADLRRITRDDLYNHYRAAYHPANAFITAVGDFDAEELFGRIERAFGQIEPGNPLPPVRVVEPPQNGERRVSLRRPAPTSYLRMAFHTPAARHPDMVAILVADAILSGGKGLGLGGGGPMGRSSRLYRSLVASGLARAAGSDFDVTVDPSLLVVGVTALPSSDPASIEDVVNRELERLATEPVPAEELERAVKQVKAQYVYSTEGVTNQAFWLGQLEIVDSYQRVDTLVEEIEQITTQDIQRIAAAYLIPTNRTVGWLLPDGPGGGEAASEDVAAFSPRRWFFTGVPAAKSQAVERPPFQRTILDKGIINLGQSQPIDPAVSVRFRLHAGAVHDPADQPGLATFTARTLTRGTPDLTYEQFSELTDSLGATVSVESGRLFTEVAVRSLREDLPRLVEVTAGFLRQPTFPEEEVEKVRAELLTSIREQDDDTHSASDRVLRELLYPEGHPYRHRVSGEEESISRISREDLIAFHERHFGPQAMIVSAVGGFDDFGGIVDLISGSFGDWSSNVDAIEPIAPPEPPASLQRGFRAIAGKSQSDIAVGYLTLARSDPDYYAFELGNLILGRLGLFGRLGASVRDKLGLAYYVFSAVEAGREGSVWISRAGVNPANVDRAIDGVLVEVEGLRDDQVTDTELADAKSFLTGSLPLALEMNDGVANLLLSIEHYDLGLDYLDRYPAIINSLTADGVLQAVRKHLDPSRLAIGVAGPG
jgi:zinc protease